MPTRWRASCPAAARSMPAWRRRRTSTCRDCCAVSTAIPMAASSRPPAGPCRCSMSATWPISGGSRTAVASSTQVLDNRIENAVFSVIERQRYDGGFGLWWSGAEAEAWLVRLRHGVPAARQGEGPLCARCRAGSGTEMARRLCPQLSPGGFLCDQLARLCALRAGAGRPRRSVGRPLSVRQLRDGHAVGAGRWRSWARPWPGWATRGGRRTRSRRPWCASTANGAACATTAVRCAIWRRS